MAEGMLEFANIPAAYVAMLPKHQQFAEKIHAYTVPRGERVSSRTKDLVDLVLLIDMGLPECGLVKQAIEATFEKRKTHSIPEILPLPPEAWKETYKEIAEDCGISQKVMSEAIEYVREYWDQIFA